MSTFQRFPFVPLISSPGNAFPLSTSYSVWDFFFLRGGEMHHCSKYRSHFCVSNSLFSFFSLMWTISKQYSKDSTTVQYEYTVLIFFKEHILLSLFLWGFFGFFFKFLWFGLWFVGKTNIPFWMWASSQITNFKVACFSPFFSKPIVLL